MASRRISLFRRSRGLLLHTLVARSREEGGEGGEGQDVIACLIQVGGGVGDFASRAVTTRLCWARTEAVPGCSKMVRARVDTYGWQASARG